jgi:hypothetical protein
MATAAERLRMIGRARELADSVQFSASESVESSMQWGNELCREKNPLEDRDLRRELDARCAATR